MCDDGTVRPEEFPQRDLFRKFDILNGKLIQITMRDPRKVATSCWYQNMSDSESEFLKVILLM